MMAVTRKGGRIHVDMGKNTGDYTVLSKKTSGMTIETIVREKAPRLEIPIPASARMGFGRAIELLRGHVQMSVPDLAYRTGLRQKRIVAMESGQFTPARNETEWRALAEAFGVTTEQLFVFSQRNEASLSFLDYPNVTKTAFVIADRADEAARWITESGLTTGRIVTNASDLLSIEPHRLEVFLVGPGKNARTRELVGRAEDRGLTIYDLRENLPPAGVSKETVATAEAIADINEKR